ncbi:MAG: hypothetical protein NTX08_08840 [Sphingobacteriales bacterium]|nr:hypothetical protein [Sphingobacteriales bacterium]
MLNFYSQAQSLAINTDGSAADVSALLDVKSTSKGLLIPRMTLAQKNVVSLPATGLLVYQTDGTKGLYVNNGTPAVPNWQLVTASSNAWGLTGNAGTIDGTNFIGTTDNIPFTIKVNNQKAGRIDHLLGNSFFGYQSGNNTSTGAGNTANGFNSLYNNVAGSNATAVGYQSMLYANNTSTAFTNYNVALGFEALRGSTTPAANTGNYNIALGYQSLWSNTTGNNNNATGYAALYSNTTGNDNVANGDSALYGNTTGSSNIAIGFQALKSNTNGNSNLAIGRRSLISNTFGGGNTAVGQNSLSANISGTNNLAIGSNTLVSNTNGYENTAAGLNTMYSNTTGYSNTAYGSYALTGNTIGIKNVALGHSAMYGASSGSFNIALGADALYHTNGNSNIAIGYKSSYNNTNTNYNVSIGDSSLYTNTVGTGNTAYGMEALVNNLDGSYNTASGTQSLSNNVHGNNNTAIGYAAGTASASLNNSTSLGYNALVNASNTMQFGNNAITDVYAGVGIAATLHSGNAIIERTLNVDYQDQNGSANTYVIKFGGAGTGEGIGSNRTTAVNQWGLDFYTGAANRMCIGLNGNIGMGTTAPTSKLDVNGQITIDQKNFGGYAGLLVKGNSSVSNYPNIAFSTQNTAANDIISAIIGGTITNNTAGSEAIDLSFYTSTSGQSGLAQRMVIKDNGNVGIGETAPIAPLNFTSAVLGNRISLWGNGATHYGMGIQAFLMQLYTQDINGNIAFGYGSSGAFTENMRIKGNGDASLKGSLTVQNGMGIIRNISGIQLKKVTAAVTVSQVFTATGAAMVSVNWPQAFSAGNIEAYVGNITSVCCSYYPILMSISDVTATGAILNVINTLNSPWTANYTVNIIAIGPQ